MRQHRSDSRRLTVLHVVQPVEGGVARVVTDLVRAQVREGFRAVVACPPDGALPALAAAAGAEVVRWAAVREPGPGLPTEVAAVARTVRETAPDLAHAHSAKAGLAVRLALRGRLPTVFQPHAWSFDAVSGARARAARRWERHAARWAARIVCVSQDELRRGQRAGVPGRWAVIRNGVDTARFAPADDAERRRARARLSGLLAPSGPYARTGPTAQSGSPALPEDAPLVVCVARLCPQKGQDVLLRAWPAVAARVPDARLVLVGDGPDRERLRRLAGDRVLFAGHHDDPAPWYAAADLVVLPSRWEGMALAPLEAMARRRPVLLSEVAGAAECLPEGHAALCLVPPEEPAALAGAAARLLADPALCDSLGRQARAHMCGAHELGRTTSAVSALYRELLGRPAELARGPLRHLETSTTRDRRR